MGIPKFVLSIILIGSFLGSGLQTHGFTDSFSSFDPSPADGITQLVNYPYNKNEVVNDQKIPLILIHGIHATKEFNKDGLLDEQEAGEQLSGWDNFIYNFENDQDLKEKYKPYRFVYLSDQQNVWEIARSLRNKLDNAIAKRFINDNEFVIIAHSMGGLVARSYMQQHSHLYGNYKNQRGGERTKLITLGTPHHGSPGTNRDSRNDLAKNADTRDSDYQRYWTAENLFNNWVSVIKAGSLFFWTHDWERIEYTEPNRKDLLWDNFDHVMDENNPDMNLWLKELNSGTLYDSKITAYYGVIDTRSDEYRTIVDKIYSLSPLAGPKVLIGQILKAEDDHKKLVCGSIALNYGLYKNRNHYERNDGMVPVASASFAGHLVSKTVACPNCDHIDLHENMSKICENGLSIFDSIKKDLIGETSPNTPKFLGEWTGLSVSAIAVNGNYAFVGYTNYPYKAYGILTLDTSDPNQTFIISRIGAKDYSRINGLLFHNGYLYAIGPEEGFSAYDVRDPYNPRLTGSIRSSYWGGAKAFARKDNLIFVAVSASIEVIDISDPYNLKRVYTYYGPGSYGVDHPHISGNLLFFVSGQTGIGIADISNPRSIKTIKTFFGNGYINNLSVNRDLLYSSTCFTSLDETGLEVFNVSDPRNPSLIKGISGSCGTNTIVDNRVGIFSHRVSELSSIVRGENGLIFFDSTNSIIFRFFYLFNLTSAPLSMTTENERLFVGTKTGLLILSY